MFSPTKHEDIDMQTRKPQSQHDSALEEYIREYTLRLAPVMSAFANSETGFTDWTAACADLNVPTDYMDFLTSLRVPCLPDTNPSLLLHEIGNGYHPAAAPLRISNVFRPGEHTYALSLFACSKHSHIVVQSLREQSGDRQDTPAIRGFVQELGPLCRLQRQATTSQLGRCERGCPACRAWR